MKYLSGKLTYANVVATLALFLVLAGGTAFAATNLAQNSVGTNQIKNSAVTTSKLKNGAVTGAKIQTGTLGTVPSASNATNAQTVGGKTAAQITAAVAPQCPAGTVLAAGLCFEPKAQAATTFFGAMEACARAGRVLPTQAQFVSFAMKNLADVGPFEWVGQSALEGGQPVGPLIQADKDGVIGSTSGKVNDKNSFRCAVPPSN